jgi:hypothetical protein
VKSRRPVNSGVRWLLMLIGDQKVRRLKINELVMHLTLALGMVVAAMTSSCVHPPVVDRQTEEYAVYSGLINSFQSQPGVDLLLVANQTTPTVSQDRELDEKEFIKYHLPDTTAKETLDDYKLSDSQPLNIANRFAINRKYILISNQEARSYFENSNTRLRLREKYPTSSGRIMTLSRVGFNRRMNEALVYAWAYCGGDCGGGGYYLLRKEDGVWRVKEKKLWIS